MSQCVQKSSNVQLTDLVHHSFCFVCCLCLLVSQVVLLVDVVVVVAGVVVAAIHTIINRLGVVLLAVT